MEKMNSKNKVQSKQSVGSPKSARSPKHNNITSPTSKNANSSKSKSRFKSPRKESGPGLRSQSRSKLIKASNNVKTPSSPSHNSQSSKSDASKRALTRRNQIRSARKLDEEKKTKEIDDALAEAEATVLEAKQIAGRGVQDRSYLSSTIEEDTDFNVNNNNNIGMKIPNKTSIKEEEDYNHYHMTSSSLPSLNLMEEILEDEESHHIENDGGDNDQITHDQMKKTHYRSDSMITQGYKFLDSDDLDIVVESSMDNNNDQPRDQGDEANNELMKEKNTIVEEVVSPDSVVSVLDQGWRPDNSKNKIWKGEESQQGGQVESQPKGKEEEQQHGEASLDPSIHYTPNCSPPRMCNPENIGQHHK
jgi:hypothetical protein